MDKNDSYVYGLLITDGSLSLEERNRGKVRLEVSEKDRDIVEKLYNFIPNSSIMSRTRDTNFSKEYNSIIFSNSRKEFRDKLIESGFPTKNKTENANVPVVEYDEFAFWRGVIDGDGSIGFMKAGTPFISLVTKSELLKESFCNFLKEHYNIIKIVNRNKRDNVYNIVINNEEAVELAKDLYLSDEEESIYLDRKYNKAKELQQWVRTTKKAPKRTPWTEEQDDFILSHSLEESMKTLNRTASSIKGRLYRLSKKS